MKLKHSVVLLAGFLAACGPSLDDVLKGHGDSGQTDLTRVTKILDDCRTLPPLAEDAVPDRLESIVFIDRLDRPEGNARTILLDAYDEPDKWITPLDSSYVRRDRWWRMPTAALARGAIDEKEIERLPDDFAALSGTKYVLVIKVLEYNPPVQVDGTSSFELGSMRGEAHLYRVSDGMRKGAILFRAFGEALGPPGFDLTLDASDPKGSIQTLTERLYGRIHEFAEARLGAKVTGVDSNFEFTEGSGFTPDKIKRK